jgi:hypothetical protein
MNTPVNRTTERVADLPLLFAPLESRAVQERIFPLSTAPFRVFHRRKEFST